MPMDGHNEKREVRSDSLTADMEGVHLVFSFAISLVAKVFCGYLESAYFIGERMSRLLLMQQPWSGLPGLRPTRSGVDTRSSVWNPRLLEKTVPA